MASWLPPAPPSACIASLVLRLLARSAVTAALAQATVALPGAPESMGVPPLFDSRLPVTEGATRASAGEVTGLPDDRNTTTNLLHVTFVSDGVGAARGFSLAYREVSDGCGGNLVLTDSDTELDVTSPRYPNAPAPNTECAWVVIAPAGKRIHVQFERLDVRGGRGRGRW